MFRSIIAEILAEQPVSEYKLPTIQIVRRKAVEKEATWSTMKRNTSPVTSINVLRVRNRFARYDWLHPSQFGGLADPFTDLGDELGFYAITLTIDRNKSKHVTNESVNFGRLLRCHDQSFKRVKGVNPAHAFQTDLDSSGFPHIHQMVLVRDVQELQVMRKHLAWWTKSHGSVDVVHLTSECDLAKWVNYMFKPRPWHENTPKGMFDSVDAYRDLGKVSGQGVPKILGTRLDVVSKEEKTTIPDFPLVVVNGDDNTLHMLQCGKGDAIAAPESLAHMVSPDWVGYLREVSTGWTPIEVFSAVFKLARQSLGQFGVLADVRLLPKEVYAAFMRVWEVGGRRRALSYLISRLTTESAEYAWRGICALRECGFTCGVLLVTDAGRRMHTNLDTTTLFGMQARSPEEIRDMKDAVWCAEAS